jgi:hypothetical protein
MAPHGGRGPDLPGHGGEPDVTTAALYIPVILLVAVILVAVLGEVVRDGIVSGTWRVARAIQKTGRMLTWFIRGS